MLQYPPESLSKYTEKNTEDNKRSQEGITEKYLSKRISNNKNKKAILKHMFCINDPTMQAQDGC